MIGTRQTIRSVQFLTNVKMFGVRVCDVTSEGSRAVGRRLLVFVIVSIHRTSARGRIPHQNSAVDVSN